MITANTIISRTSHRARVNFEFDKRISLPSTPKTFENEDDANKYIDRQLHMAIRGALLKFARQRKQAYLHSKTPFSTHEKIMCADHVIAEISHHVDSHLVVLAAVVHWHRHYLYRISPSVSSRYRKHWDEIIMPLIDWCTEVSHKHRSKAL